MLDCFIDYLKKYIPADNTIPEHIIIWIHGTRSHEIFPPTYISPHKKNEFPSFRYSPYGLHPMLTLDPDLHVYSIVESLHLSDPLLYPREHIYLFGWSGAFSREGRTAAGATLYEQLSSLVSAYKNYYAKEPLLTIITHSHGGNVALEAAATAQKNCLHKECSPLIVDKLVLLACPVQEHTHTHTESLFFKKIYSIHSHKDYFQILDMQGFHPVLKALSDAFTSISLQPLKTVLREHTFNKIFSERHFKSQPDLKQACLEWGKNTERWSIEDLSIMKPYLTEKQIVIFQKQLQKYDNRKRGLMHIEFLLSTFMQRLPSILATLEATPNTDAISITIEL